MTSEYVFPIETGSLIHFDPLVGGTFFFQRAFDWPKCVYMH